MIDRWPLNTIGFLQDTPKAYDRCTAAWTICPRATLSLFSYFTFSRYLALNGTAAERYLRPE